MEEKTLKIHFPKGEGIKIIKASSDASVNNSIYILPLDKQYAEMIIVDQAGNKRKIGFTLPDNIALIDLFDTNGNLIKEGNVYTKIQITALLDTLSNLIKSSGHGLNLTGNTLKLVDKDGNSLSEVQLEISNINGLSEQLGKKLDKPTTTVPAPTSTWKWVPILNDNNETVKMLAGDLGKNVANSALTSVAGAGLTLGANWALNASGFYYSITGLNDVSNDSTFNLIVTQNVAGRVAKSNGKQPFMALPNILNEAEKTAWKTAMNGGWTTASMSVNAITPLVVDSTKNDDTYITLRGANLNFNPNSFSITILNSTATTVLYTIPSNQVILNSSGQFITFYFKFYNQPSGQVVIRLWNGVAYYDVPIKLTLSNNISYINLESVTWTKIGKDGHLSPNSFAAGGLLVYEHPPQIPNAEDQAILFAAKSEKIFNKQANWYLRGSITRTWPVGISWDNSQSNPFTFLGINNSAAVLTFAQDLISGVKISNESYAYQSFRTFDNQVEGIASSSAMVNFSISKSNNLVQVVVGNKSYTLTLDVDDKDFSFAFFAPNRNVKLPVDATNKDRTEVNLLSAFYF